MIELPVMPQPQGCSPAFVDHGGFIRPMLGGTVQRINRMGARFRFEIAMPPMPSADAGRVWLSRLLRGKQEGARLPLPLLAFNPGAAGAVVVAGAGQAGQTLNVKGANPYYAFREGQWFSILTGGRHRLNQVTAETIASATGAATLPLLTSLREQPADLDACHFAQPMIEGFIGGDELGWQMTLAHNLELSFTVEEF